MLADSALFVLAAGLRSLLAQHIDGVDVSDVLIGTPKQANDISSLGGNSPSHTLNLFFYRFEPGGYPSAGMPEQPLYLRAYCLLTAFAGKGNGGNEQGGAGQNDLRLLGEAMRVLHEHPQLGDAVGHDMLASVQIVPISLSIHELNLVWSMMGSEVSYRPSAAYELALVPLALSEPVDRLPKVAGFAIDSGPDEQPGALARQPPRVALVTEQGRGYALSVPLAERPATIQLAIEGRVGDQVLLRWRLLQDSNVGWVDGPSSEAMVLTADGLIEDVALPLTTIGQAMVWAEVVGDPSAASKPVLVILHAEASP